MIQLVECPRDAMQGMADFVPTTLKAQYLNLLLQCGFDVLDFGSFVSPKAIPQMADTEEVLSLLKLEDTKTKLLAIVANERGVENAAKFSNITYLGFPLSVSETFQQRNTNASISKGIETVKMALESCAKHHQELVVYLSMAFGNPYSDDYSPAFVAEMAADLRELGVKNISLADTVGLAKEEEISNLFKTVQFAVPEVSMSLHLHSEKESAMPKIIAGHEAGCTKFEGALMGFGGCPMAQNDLVGNIDTQLLIALFEGKHRVDTEKLQEALGLASHIFH